MKSLGKSGEYFSAGWDVSLNHSAAVLLGPSGELVDFSFIAQKVGDAKKGRQGTAVPAFIRNEKDRQQREAFRLRFVSRWVDQVRRSFEFHNADTVHGVEDYAFSAVGRSYQIGEVGGLVRLGVLSPRPNGKSGGRLRLHDPLAVKLFATGSAKASKDEMVEAVRNLGQDFSKYGGAEEDLSDAFVIARMVWTESELRAGRISLEHLDEGPRRVFLRATKKTPVNLLGRDWIAVSAADEAKMTEALGES